MDAITASDPGISIGTASDSIDILDGDAATLIFLLIRLPKLS